MSFSESLAIKCVSLGNELCMARPTPIDLNLVVLNYYSFMIILNKSNTNCNAVNELSMKMCVPSKTKDVKIKVLNLIKRKMKLKN